MARLTVNEELILINEWKKRINIGYRLFLSGDWDSHSLIMRAMDSWLETARKLKTVTAKKEFIKMFRECNKAMQKQFNDGMDERLQAVLIGFSGIDEEV